MPRERGYQKWKREFFNPRIRAKTFLAHGTGQGTGFPGARKREREKRPRVREPAWLLEREARDRSPFGRRRSSRFFSPPAPKSPDRPFQTPASANAVAEEPTKDRKEVVMTQSHTPRQKKPVPPSKLLKDLRASFPEILGEHVDLAGVHWIVRAASPRKYNPWRGVLVERRPAVPGRKNRYWVAWHKTNRRFFAK